MAIDSVLGRPGIKNQQLTAAVEKYRGYVSGFGVNTDLKRYAPDDIKGAIKSVNYARDKTVKKETGEGISFSRSKDEIYSEKIIGLLLNTSLGAYYTKDFITHKDINSISNNDQDESRDPNKPLSEHFDVLSDNIKILIPKKSGIKNLDKNIARTFLRQVDSSVSSNLDDSRLAAVADVKLMIGDVSKTTERVNKRSVTKYYYDSAVVNDSETPLRTSPVLASYVIRNPRYTFATRNQEFLSVFFNAINPIDMSKSSPYISMTIFNEVPTAANPHFLNQVAYMRFENKGITDFLITNPTDQSRLGTAYKRATTIEKGKAAPISTITTANMNIFTSPQTMNNGNINNTSNLSASKLSNMFKSNSNSSYDDEAFDNVLDPLAPMLSLENLTVTISEGGNYVVSSRKAEMKLILHDRSRLKDIATFATPGGVQKAVVKLEFGWSHPDGNPHNGTTIGKFINASRETAYYRLSTSDLRLEGSKVNITLKLDFLGGQESRNISSADGQKKDLKSIRPYFDAAFDVISKKIKKSNNSIHKKLKIIQKSFNSVEELIDTRENNVFMQELTNILKGISSPGSSSDTPSISDKVSLSLLKKMFELVGVFTKDEMENLTLKALIKKIKKKDFEKEKIGSSVRDTKLTHARIRERYYSLTGKIPFKYELNRAESESDSSQSRQEQLEILQSRGSNLTMNSLRNFTPDYFASVNCMHFKSAAAATMKEGTPADKSKAIETFKDFIGKKGFITLGKLINALVAYPKAVQGMYNEVQVLFYPVNQNAGKARVHTTASLPILVKSFQDELDKRIAEGAHFTPDFTFKILSHMLQDENNFIYGLHESNQSLEKELKKTYGYKNKDGEITLNNKGKKDAYADYNAKLVETGGESVIFEGNTPEKKALRQRAYHDFVDKFKTKNTSTVLETIYKTDGLEQAKTNSLQLIHLNMDIEVCPVIDPGFDISKLSLEGKNSNPYLTDSKICKIHVYDSNASPRPEFNFLSSVLNDGDRYLGYAGSSNTVYDGISSVKDSNGKTTSIVTGKYGSSKPLQLSEASKMIMNMSPSFLKNIVKREYPSITYGAESSVIKSINLSSTTENNISYAKSVQAMSDQEKGIFTKWIDQNQVDLNVIPSTIDIQMIGCPFLRMGSHIYVDTGTNTDFDNVYMVNTMTHVISPGIFQTSATFLLPNAGSTSTLRQSLTKSLMVLAEEQDIIENE